MISNGFTDSVKNYFSELISVYLILDDELNSGGFNDTDISFLGLFCDSHIKLKKI
jgi:hypothetical protein